MKRFFLVVLVFWSSCARAEDVALNFASVPLVQFAQSMYRGLLKRDFVVSPELLAADKPISVSVRSISTDDLPRFVEGVLSAQGVKSELRNGVYFLGLSSCDGGGCSAGSSGGGIALTGPVVGKSYGGLDVLAASGGGSGAGAAALASHQSDDGDWEREVYRPRNRRSDFIGTIVNAAFSSKPAIASGGVVVLTGTRKQLDKMLKLCDEVDDQAVKVRVSATFVEVSTNEASGVGVSLVANVLGARLGVKLGDASAGSLSLSSGGFQAVIDAIASDGRFKQVAAPTAIVDAYEKGSLSFGDSVPTLASTTLDRNGNAVQQVTYQQSGILLNVSPSVVGSGRINVVVDGQISSFAPTTTGVSGSPTLSKRQVQTSVTLNDGEVVLIGGLNNNKTVSAGSGFSFLPKSWATRSDSSANTDLVLVLAASVVK
jgi:hypothetical protein